MRHSYLVCYDIADAKRLRRVHKTMRGYGDALQYSVFRCDLSRQERVLMLEALQLAYHATDDRIMIVDLGPTRRKGRPRVQFLGRPPERGAGDEGALVI